MHRGHHYHLLDQFSPIAMHTHQSHQSNLALFVNRMSSATTENAPNKTAEHDSACSCPVCLARSAKARFPTVPNEQMAMMQAITLIAVLHQLEPTKHKEQVMVVCPHLARELPTICCRSDGKHVEIGRCRRDYKVCRGRHR